MRIVKMLGLVAVAALAALAFVGANSASATVLCETTPTTISGEAVCHKGWDVLADATIPAKSNNALLTTNISNIKCSSSESRGTVTNTGGKGQVVWVHLNKFSLTSCKITSFPFSACTVEVKNLPYSGAASHAGGHNGVLSEGKGTGGNPGARVVCAGFIDCTFGAPGGLKLEAKGGSPASLTITEQELTKEAGGLLCPKTATLHATYTTEETDDIWFADRSE